MWIYSLGKTLENCVSPETIVSDIPADNCQLSYEWNKNNSGKSPIDLNSPVDGSGGVKSSEPYQISFDYVLAAMCEPDINQRATLMNLLDVSNVYSIIGFVLFVEYFIFTCHLISPLI